MTRPLALLVALALALAACNTVRGVGEDMSTAGRALSDTAADVAARDVSGAAAELPRRLARSPPDWRSGCAGDEGVEECRSSFSPCSPC